MDPDADPLKTEIAHVLFLDMEGYSRLSLEAQAQVVRDLHSLVRATREFSQREAQGELLRVDTGDGMALVFFGNPQSPIQCACEITEALGHPPRLPIRIGLHSGPVIRTRDINGRENAVGGGINTAQRVMDCGDAGHILLSRSYADILRQMERWAGGLHDLGEVPTKHGVRLPLVSFQRDACGNPAPPRRLSVLSTSPPTNLPFWRAAQFVGRTSTLALVYALLQTEAPVALVGISGLGKTQLALHYAHLHRGEYPGGVFWINAADSAHLREDYVTLGQGFFNLPEGLPAESCIARLRDCLSRLLVPALLIFDNVTEETDLSLLPSSAYCRLLLTTQNKYLLPPSFEVLALPKLDTDAALTLLHGVSDTGEAERTAARQIAAAVGRLPLALALIAQHRQRLRISFAEYQQRLLTSEPQIRRTLERAREKFTAATGHKGSIFDTIERSYHSLTPAAQTALTAASVFAPAGITRGLLRKVLGNTAEPGRDAESDWDEALADLADAALISEEETTETDSAETDSAETDSAETDSAETDSAETESTEIPGEPLLRLHELVRLFARMQLADAPFRQNLVCVTGVLTERLQAANERLDWREVRLDLAHVYSAVTECRERDLPEDLCRLLIALGRFLTLNRDFRGAGPYLQEGLTLAERLHGPVHLIRAQILRLLSEGEHIENIHSKKSLRDARAALRIAKQMYPTDAVELWEYYVFVGYILKDMGRFRRAQPFYEKTRHLQMDVHEGRHPKVADCLNYLGMFHFEQGEFAEAERHLREALAIKSASPDRPTAEFTPYLLHNLGRILAAQEQWEEALEMHQSALAMDKRIHGTTHARIASSLYYSAVAFAALCRVSEARTHYEQALALYVQLFGADNLRCAAVREKLAALKTSD